MDAETRAVAERLRDGLTARDDGRLPDGIEVSAGGSARFGIVVGGGPPGYALVHVFGVGSEMVPIARLLPNLSAPATWGVLLGLLLAAKPTVVTVSAWPGPTGAHEASVDSHAEYSETIGTGPPGLALARALLAAWGTP